MPDVPPSVLLITGGTGFIGSRLALRVRQRGRAVRVLAQLNTPAERDNAQELSAAGVEIVVGSVTDPAAVARACAGVDVLYHLAAAQHEANVPDQHFHEVNVQGTLNVVLAARAAQVRRLVHGSTIGVFGRDASGLTTEHSPLLPENIYGITKLAGEGIVRHHLSHLPATIVRISETYGPGDRRLLKLFRAIKGGRFFHIGTGDNWHHPVFIDDLLDGLERAAEEPQAIGANLILPGPRPVTTTEMIEAVAAAVGAAPPHRRVPLGPLKAVAFTLETLLRPIGVQPPLHRRRLDFFVRSYRFEREPAQALLGYQPRVDFVEGARLTAQWYREKRLL